MIHSPKIALRVHLLDAMKTGTSSTVANGGPHKEIFWISTRIAVLCSRTRNCWCSSGACFAVFYVIKKIKEFIRKNSSSGPRENCLKHREHCFTLLEDSRGEIFGEWIIDLDGLCIWRWYEVHSKYLQNSFVYLSSRHVAGFWRMVTHGFSRFSITRLPWGIPLQYNL